MRDGDAFESRIVKASFVPGFNRLWTESPTAIYRQDLSARCRSTGCGIRQGMWCKSRARQKSTRGAKKAASIHQPVLSGTKLAQPAGHSKYR
jgi:hypothetical protein